MPPLSSASVTTAPALEARRARRDALAGVAFVAPAVLWLLLFFAAPLVVMVTISLSPSDQDGAAGGVLSLGNYRAFFAENAYVQALWNSVVTTATVTAVSLLLAYPLALTIATRLPKRLQRIALTLAILPFWTSYVVRSYAWLLALAPTGVVNRTLLALGLIQTPLRLAYNAGATDLGFVHFFIMLNTLTIYASLVQINPRYALAARDLGASAFRAFLSVTLPLSVPGIAVGAFLTVVLCIGDYVTPQILGGFRGLLLPQVIMMQIQRRLDLPMASAMSLLLTLVVALVYLALQRWLRTAKL
ncbi:MAG TPA: ABC transporter permease [Acetobacteraceae bacterium]|nr:ABC transporter permease [Acetobacteraceae bacterium]